MSYDYCGLFIVICNTLAIEALISKVYCLDYFIKVNLCLKDCVQVFRMENNVKEIVIKLNDGNRLEVSRETLTVEGKIFLHLLDELKQDELQFDDLSPDSVELFITLLRDRALDQY